MKEIAPAPVSLTDLFSQFTHFPLHMYIVHVSDMKHGGKKILEVFYFMKYNNPDFLEKQAHAIRLRKACVIRESADSRWDLFTPHW